MVSASNEALGRRRVPPTSEAAAGEPTRIPGALGRNRGVNVARRAGANPMVTQGLGWVSLALGTAALLGSRRLGTAIGMEGREALLRVAGARELVAAWGLLRSGESTPWLWARVAGDVMDLAMLGASATQAARQPRALKALGVVAAVTAVDVWAALGASSKQYTRPQGRAYSARSAEGTLAETIVVKKTPEECYRYWRKLAQLPSFMPLLRSVVEIDEARSHWVFEGPAGVQLEWDSQITHDEPGRRIAWRSLPNSQLAHAGVVRFSEATGKRGTLVRLTADYRLLPQFGGSRHLVSLIQKAPRARLREDLRRFKALLETGVLPTTEGQPHGRRSMLGKAFQRWSIS